MGYSDDDIVEVVTRIYDGVWYQVTIYEHRHVPPWGDRPVRFCTAKWERIGREQMTLFDE